MNQYSRSKIVFQKILRPKCSKGLLLPALMLALFYPASISVVQADDSTAPAATAVAEPAVPETSEADTGGQSAGQGDSQSQPAENPVSDVAAAADTNQAPAAVQSNQVMSDQEKERAIAQMGANQGDVWVWSPENVVEGETRGPNGGPGQFNGGAVVLGGRPTYDPAADWYYLAYKAEGMTDEEAQAVFNGERGKWMDEFDPWGVALEMADNKASNAWADIRNMQAFILRKDSNTWEKIVDDPAGVQWVAQFKGNMSSYVEDAQQEALPNGGTAVQILPKQDRVAHWGSNQARGIANPETIQAVLVSVEARISDKSDPEAQLGIQVGGDWKFAEEVSKPLWYPGAGLAGIQRLTKDWARYYFVSLAGVQDAMPERSISRERFLTSVLPLADMPNPAQEPDQAVQPVQAENITTGSQPAGAADPSLLAHEPAGRPSPAHQSAAHQLPQTGSRSSDLWSSLVSTVLLGLGLGLLGYQKKDS